MSDSNNSPDIGNITLALFKMADLNMLNQVALDIPEELTELEDDGQSTDTMLVRLKQSHMQQQNDLVKDLKYMSDESKKIIDQINVIQIQLQKYQNQIDNWIKTIGDMEGFVSKVKTVQQPFEKKCKNMSKLKQLLTGDKSRRR